MNPDTLTAPSPQNVLLGVDTVPAGVRVLAEQLGRHDAALPAYIYDLDGLAARNLYLDQIEDTVLIGQVSSIIERFRDELPATRRPMIFPH